MGGVVFVYFVSFLLCVSDCLSDCVSDCVSE